MPLWIAYAILAALAALVAVLGKVGLKEVDATLATAVRAVVMAGLLVTAALDRLSVVLVFVLAVVFLGEAFTAKAALGAVLVVAGAILLT